MSYRVGIDVGGTFTDLLLVEDQGRSRIFKTSTTPEDPSIGLMNGLSEIAVELSLTLEQFLAKLTLIVHGTTVATNAVLTESGARTGLVTTEGFRDALQMRRGIRESQYDNRFVAPRPLVPRHRRLTVRERTDYRGEQQVPLHLGEVRSVAARMRELEVESIAICLLHSHADGSHEQRLAEIFREELPDCYLSVSSELLPQIRFYDRTSTTALNSYVGPLIETYLRSLQLKLEKQGFRGVLLIMQSNGGVAGASESARVAAATVLSGPAAGPVAGLAFVKPHGFEDCITVDMGGTSFDAALIVGGVPVQVTDGRINGHLTALPKLDIHTIGAGGGSIGWIDAGGFLRMGPQSAGAAPGPACYNRGGIRPTCSDADLVLGYLNPEYFLGGRIALSADQATTAIEREIARPLGMDVEKAAAGMYTVINHAMADGIREITIQRGYDPRDFPLVVAGGAGPIHAAEIARELEIALILIPRASSIFCAAGMLLSDLRHSYVRTYSAPFEELDAAVFAELCDEMGKAAHETLSGEGIPEESRRLDFSADIRCQGQFSEVRIPVVDAPGLDLEKMTTSFHARHDQLYGYALPEAALELVTLRLEAVGITEKPKIVAGARGTEPAPVKKGERSVFLPEQDTFQQVTVFDGDRLEPGHRIAGPALLEQVTCTVFVPSDFHLVCDPTGSFAMFPAGQADRFEEELAKGSVRTVTPFGEPEALI